MKTFLAIDDGYQKEKGNLMKEAITKDNQFNRMMT